MDSETDQVPTFDLINLNTPDTLREMHLMAMVSLNHAMDHTIRGNGRTTNNTMRLHCINTLMAEYIKEIINMAKLWAREQ